MAEHCKKWLDSIVWDAADAARVVERTRVKIVTEEENLMWWFLHHLVEAMIVDSDDIISMVSDPNVGWCKDLL